MIAVTSTTKRVGLSVLVLPRVTEHADKFGMRPGRLFTRLPGFRFRGWLGGRFGRIALIRGWSSFHGIVACGWSSFGETVVCGWVRLVSKRAAVCACRRKLFRYSGRD